MEMLMERTRKTVWYENLLPDLCAEINHKARTVPNLILPSSTSPPLPPPQLMLSVTQKKLEI